jgi:protein-tyrosine phosphatase
MTDNTCSRHIDFQSVLNFRDLGGYRTCQGETLAWRRLFRSGEFSHISPGEFNRLREEIGLKSVIDLRSSLEIEQQGLGLMEGAGLNYHNISLIADGGDPKANEQRYKNFTHMGEFYIYLMRQDGYGERVIEALEIIAALENQPLVFHCAVGKDRTGIIAAVLLSILGVPDEEIIRDYALSAEPMKVVRERLRAKPDKPADAEGLPDYFWAADPQAMAYFLSTLNAEFGSVQDYLKARGAELSLVQRLKKALLI